jgi:pimeloyl-ACP methyl ester carboxylesterase
MKKLVYCSMAAVLIFSVMVAVNSYAHDPWKVDWEYRGVTVSDYDPDLKHYVWETPRPPYDNPFNKIALHRFIREPHNWDADPYRPSHDPRKVLFIIPGTWDRGFPKGSDPNISETWFFAANGYDVYSIEFRTGYIIPNLAKDEFGPLGYGDALKGTADWTYNAFREDIKACVELAKKLSRAKKLFLAGRSRGGTQMWIYAAKYWKEDLKGLISLDGGGPNTLVIPSNKKSLSEYEAAVAAFKAAGSYLSEVGSYDLGQFAGAVPFAKTAVGMPLPPTNLLNPPIPPFAPLDKSKIEFVSDLIAYGSYYTWGAGMVTNYYKPYPGGNGETYMDRDALIKIQSNFTRYWPSIQDLEGSVMSGYTPKETTTLFDYNHTGDVNLPILFFGSEFGCKVMYACLELNSPIPPGTSVQPRTASTDVTSIILTGYGHLDVYAGTHSRETVKQPALEWMNQRLK